jgi:DNA-binding transcriptional LysR family regulator
MLRVPELIEELSRDAESPRLELVQGVTRSITEEVSAGRLDAGFIFGAQTRSGLAAITLCRVELVIAAPISFRERLKGASLPRILGEAWVWPPMECPFHDKALELFREAGSVPPIGVTADDESTILRLIRSGVGLSLLPSFMLKEKETRGEVFCLRPGASGIELSFIYREKDGNSPTLRLLRSVLAHVWRLEQVAPGE